MTQTQGDVFILADRRTGRLFGNDWFKSLAEAETARQELPRDIAMCLKPYSFRSYKESNCANA